MGGGGVVSPSSPNVLPPPSFGTHTTATATSDINSSLPLPSRLPFDCSSVQVRGGPLLQPVEVACDKFHLDLSSGCVTAALRWPVEQESMQDDTESVASPTVGVSSTCLQSPTGSKKRGRRQEEDDNVACSPTAPASRHTSTLLGAPPSHATITNGEEVPAAVSEADTPSLKRTRTSTRRLFHATPSSATAAAAAAHARPVAVRYTEWTLPLSSVVGVDFAISLDTPATCTFALKPPIVYSTERTHTDDDGRVRRAAAPELVDLPVYSPARILLASYQSAAAQNPARFHRYTRFIQRFTPPFLYWLWLYSTYLACGLLALACANMYCRFWITGTAFLIAYLALLVREVRHSQQEFRKRLLRDRQPLDEVRQTESTRAS